MTDHSPTESVRLKLLALATRIGEGGRLPSVRALIRTCGVSQGVVVNALDQLEAEGVIERRSRSGVFVSPSFRRRPRLVICEPNMFINPSPFGELLLSELIQPFQNRPDEIEIIFTHPQVVRSSDVNTAEFLPAGIWQKLQAKRYPVVIAAGVDHRVCAAIEELGVRVVSYGATSRYEVQTARLEACQLGVAELSRQGIHRLALSNLPWVSSREVFLAATSVHGAKEIFIPLDEQFDREMDQRLVRQYRFMERGRRAALRSLGPSISAAERPNGLVSLDDMYTLGYLQGVYELGLRLNEDIAIATYTNLNSPTLAGYLPELIQMQFTPADIAIRLHGLADHFMGEADWPEHWISNGYSPSQGERWSSLVRPTLIKQSVLTQHTE